MVSPRTFAVATEEELYAEIARAWYRMDSAAGHIERPMQPYTIGPEFANEVWSQREDSAQRIVAVCARVVSFHNWQLSGAQRVASVDEPPREALDPAAAWWQPLKDPPELGVHYWILGNGTVEFRSLASLHAPPPPEYGRFATTHERRGIHATSRIERSHDDRDV